MAGYLLINHGAFTHESVPITRLTVKVNVAGKQEYNVQLIKKNKVLVLSLTTRTSDSELRHAEAQEEANRVVTARIADVETLEKEVRVKTEQLKKSTDGKDRAALLQGIDEWTQLIQQHMRSLQLQYNAKDFKLSVPVKNTETIQRVHLRQFTRYKLDKLEPYELVWVRCAGDPERLVFVPTVTTEQSTEEVDVLDRWYRAKIRGFFIE